MSKNLRYSQIGIDRIIRLNWMERTAYLVLAGNNVPEAKKMLKDYLQRWFRSKTTSVRGSLDKTITILLRAWARPPKELNSLRQKGLGFLSCLPQEDHIAVHWGMIMAVYPFWGSVATQVGRLLRLQGNLTVSQVQRRLKEQYGERKTVSRAAQRVLRSFTDWGVLRETEKKGIYTQGNSFAIVHEELIAWLVEAFLHTHPNGSVALRTVLDSTSLFPFRLNAVSADSLVMFSQGLEVLRQGLDQDLIILRMPR